MTEIVKLSMLYFYRKDQKGEKIMTKFDVYVEGIEERRKKEKERIVDAWILRSLRTRTKEEVLLSLSDILFLGKQRPIKEKEVVFF